MRTDLTKACPACVIRLPAASPLCPRCRGELTTVQAALGSLPKIRPLRDALLHVPVIFVYGLGLWGALYALAWPGRTESAGTALWHFVLSLFLVGGGFSAGFLGGWAIWAVWAALVSLALSWTAPVRIWLCPRPFGAPPERELRFAIRKRWWIAAGALAVGLSIALVASARREPFDEAVYEVIGFTLFFAILFVPVGFAAAGIDWLARRLTPLREYLRHQRVARFPAQLGDARRSFVDVDGRSHVLGRAEHDGPSLVAPISGERCVAVRLVGRIGDLVIDDAAIVQFVVRSAEELVLVRGEAVVALPAQPAQPITDPEARARAIELLSRTLGPLEGPMELAESYVIEGDDVRVHGVESSEVASDGYRSGGVRRVLDDADGRPILVERP